MEQARFFTKIVGGEDLTKYNNQIVEILEYKKSKTYIMNNIKCNS